ncbi:type IV secretion system protein [Mesorhizobium sp. GbtcB19]|uniref:type IV secretion system protein n=1 Tax=Mesorhizobium sp. GbtcB19 TaxID=2824764 RepID=UPI001C30FC99|nr:type IV secretion system protein [Mesorhizobium sp. GbtcB19]
MGLISDVATTIDTILTNYVQTVFTGVSEPILALLNSMALAGLMFIAVNHLIQFRSINYSEYLHWILRYLVIYSFASVWVNFKGIYDIFHGVSVDYSTIMIDSVAGHITGEMANRNVLNPKLIHDLYSGMDEFGHAIIWIAYDFIRDTSISDVGGSLKNVFCGVVILIIGGFFLGACAIIVIVAQVGLALAISLAPLGIITLMMDQTKSYFQNWLHFTLGFAVVQLLTGALMALVLYVAGETLINSGYTNNNKIACWPFMFVMVAAIVLLFQLPTMAQSLSGSAVAAVGGGAGKYVASKAMQYGSKARSGGRRLADASMNAVEARKSGASVGRSVMSAFAGFRQSAAMRSQRRDQRLSSLMRGQAGPQSPARRYHGGQAASGGAGSGNNSSNGQVSPEQQNLYNSD